MYGLAVRLAAPFHSKAKAFSSGRSLQDLEEIREKCRSWNNCNIYWIHASSYGEFEMAKPIIKALNDLRNVKFVVSFHSPSGYEQVHLSEDDHLKIYLPLDLKKNQKNLIAAINPTSVIFIKYDFWFNLLSVLNKMSIPYYFVGIHMNEDHYLFKSGMKKFLGLISDSATLYCHNKSSRDIFNSKGISNVKVLGDTRLAQVNQNKNENKSAIHWTTGFSKTIIFGSLLEDEFKMARKFINSTPNWNIIIAPHEIEDKYINEIQKGLGTECSLYSEVSTTDSRVLIVNTMGDLKYLYKNCDVAYVGGGFDKGPHNILEPMIFGIPTVIGPNVHKYPMARYLANKELLIVLNGENDFQKGIEQALEIPKENIASELDTLFNEFNSGFKEMISELSLKPSHS